MRITTHWVDQIKDKENNQTCIYDIAFSPDGNFLLAAADTKVHVYDINNGSLVQTLKGHKEVVTCLSYSNDGKRFASGSYDKQVIIWTSKWEGILKYSHNDSIRCLQYNPKYHQLLSCTNTDFGIWSPEQKTVAKTKVVNQINCCCWNEEGNLFMLGLTSGVVSIRYRNGDEKVKIERSGAVWGVQFFRTKDNFDLVALADWSKTLSFYDLNGKVIFKERIIGFDPLFIELFHGKEFFLIGGANKKISLYTLEGVFIDHIAHQQGWVWCTKTFENKLAFGCQDGSIGIHEVNLLTVHSLYKERYAFRDSITDVVIQHLITGEKVRIKCRDFVKKVAVYDKSLAIQLPERIILYKIRDGQDNENMNYQVKEKINKKLQCSLLVLCSSNMILCFEKKLQSLTFAGETKNEWCFNSTIRYVKATGGLDRQEGLLVGLKDGQIYNVFLSSILPISLIKINSAVRCLDLSAKRKKLAVIDEKNKCSVFDVHTKQLLFEESNVNSMTWNSSYEDLICFSGATSISIKTPDFPIQVVTNELNNKTFVIGFYGHRIFTLHKKRIVSCDISFSKIHHQYIEQNKLDSAYKVACLNVTYEDWQALAHAALQATNFPLAKKCLIKLENWRYLDLLDAHNHNADQYSSEQNKIIFLARYNAYRGLFAEAGKLYRKARLSQLAADMFTDLQMYDQAKEFATEGRVVGDIGFGESREVASGRMQVDTERTSGEDTNTSIGNIKTMSELYILKGDYDSALELIAKTSIDNVVNVASKLDKSQTKMLLLISEHLMKQKEYEHAIKVYHKIGDFRNLALAYVSAQKWEEAFKIATDYPQFRSDIYLPYALWLAEQEKFIEAQQAFYEAGEIDKSFDVLNKLLTNAISESRFNDASYYSWLLANHFAFLAHDQTADKTNNNGTALERLRRAEDLHKNADMYYAYDIIHKYIEEPFTSIFVEILFNCALYLFYFIDDILPQGISKVNILFALSKLGKMLGHYKLARIAFKRLQSLRIPKQFEELIEIGAIEIQTKPFVDSEELVLFCYRCSSTNFVMTSRHNRCTNCEHQFHRSFYSFDVLPLVEFEIEVSHTRFLELINGSTVANNNNNGEDDGQQHHQQETIESNRQTLELGHSSVDTTNQQINILNLSKNVNEATNLIVLGEQHLSRLSSHQASVIIHENRYDGTHRYFINMMPELSITSCAVCNKFFYSDEFEYQILKNKKCLFCRN